MNVQQDHPWRVSSSAGVQSARPSAGALERRRPHDAAKLVTRRSLLRSSFWAGLGVTGAGFLLGFVNFIWPRTVRRADVVITVPAAQVPEPGAGPKHFPAGRFYLVNLRPGEGIPEAFSNLAAPSESGGILALSQKCPHLGCSVPWRPEFAAAETFNIKSWFRCPCHASTYSAAGVRVYGPAPRSMDTFAVRVRRDGSVEVDTSAPRPGGTDNPQRAVMG